MPQTRRVVTKRFLNTAHIPSDTLVFSYPRNTRQVRKRSLVFPQCLRYFVSTVYQTRNILRPTSREPREEQHRQSRPKCTERSILLTTNRSAGALLIKPDTGVGQQSGTCTYYCPPKCRIYVLCWFRKKRRICFNSKNGYKRSSVRTCDCYAIKTKDERFDQNRRVTNLQISFTYLTTQMNKLQLY